MKIAAHACDLDRLSDSVHEFFLALAVESHGIVEDASPVDDERTAELATAALAEPIVDSLSRTDDYGGTIAETLQKIAFLSQA